MASKKLAPKTRVLATYREWRVTLPHRDTDDWKRLVRLITQRDDMRIDWWSDEMIVTSLVSDAELTGNHEVSYPVWNGLTETFEKRVLATVEYAPVTAEPVFDPEHYRIMLDSSEPVMQVGILREELHRVFRQIELRTKTEDEPSVEGTLRGVFDDLEKFVSERYGA